VSASVSNHYLNRLTAAEECWRSGGHASSVARRVRRSDLPCDESGDRREEIFRDVADRRMFLAALAEVCGKTHWPMIENATNGCSCVNIGYVPNSHTK
jgi:hypothetical protein